MSSSLPPQYYFSGIAYNPSNYSSTSENLTLQYANQNYLASTGSATSTATTSFTNPVTLSGSLTLPTTINGVASSTMNLCTSTGSIGTATLNIGSGYGTDLRTININAGGSAGNLTIGALGSNNGPQINLYNCNKLINILSLGVAGNGINIGAINNVSSCPINLNTLGGIINTSATTIGTSSSPCNIIGSGSIGTTSADTLSINATTNFNSNIFANGATITPVNLSYLSGLTSSLSGLPTLSSTNYWSGNNTGITQAPLNNSTLYATTGYTDSAVSQLSNSSVNGPLTDQTYAFATDMTTISGNLTIGGQTTFSNTVTQNSGLQLGANLGLVVSKATAPAANKLGYQLSGTCAATASLVSTTAVQIGSIALPAGTWILLGTAIISCSTGGTLNFYRSTFSTASAVVISSGTFQQEDVGVNVLASYFSGNTFTTYVYVSIPTTYYLNGNATFSSGTFNFTSSSSIKAIQIA